MKVVALDSDWDAQDDLLGLTSEEEVMRFWLGREKHMTDVLEEEVLNKGGNALVHTGYAHSLTCKHVRPTLGYWLREKYGDRVFQICLHLAHSQSGPDRPSPLIRLVETLMKENGNRPLGFDVEGSPSAQLRDGDSPFFSHLPNLVLADIAQGYVFLKPLKSLSKVTWIRGFIDESNFERARAVALKRGWIKEGECTTPEMLDSYMAKLFASP